VLQFPPMDTSHEHLGSNAIIQCRAVAPAANNVAKPAKPAYRRNLPHLQPSGSTLFITITTYRRWVMPAEARDIVLEHCMRENGTRLNMYGIVVMPDHVHMIAAPLRDAVGNIFGIAQILHSIKSVTSHRINKLLSRRGPVWQHESFDHVLRSSESLAEKVLYICLNPIRKGLVKSEMEYPWLWRAM
jgi:REP element-mobilizing transposase RayT